MARQPGRGPGLAGEARPVQPRTPGSPAGQVSLPVTRARGAASAGDTDPGAGFLSAPTAGGMVLDRPAVDERQRPGQADLLRAPGRDITGVPGRRQGAPYGPGQGRAAPPAPAQAPGRRAAGTGTLVPRRSGPWQDEPGGPPWQEGELDGTIIPPSQFGQPGEPRQRSGHGHRGRGHSGSQEARSGKSRRDDRAGHLAEVVRLEDAHGNGRGKRVWLWAGAAAVVAVSAGAVAASSMLGSHVTPHVLVIPSHLGAFQRNPQLEQQLDVKELQQQVITKSGGQATHVVSAVYENGTSGSSTSQIMLFIGGNLSGVSPATFVASFTNQFKGASGANPGTMGGSASCVNSQASTGGRMALCTWADGDTFGVVASPTMSVTALSAQMLTIRPIVERNP
ncbi:MAG TPA: hypothetical protein VGS19_32070 [Streptosporangiaceae bacterium]|nr:hypothetical protein [Streptosporangiaceae bacterium]